MSTLWRSSCILRQAMRLVKPVTCSYHGMADGSSVDGVKVIDLRSDLLTQPTEAMKQAMINATWGDDVYNEEPTVHKLQDYMAEQFGMEASLFVPSGTMGNLLCVLAHCDWGYGLEAVIGDKSHICLYEQGGLSVLGGIHTRQVPTLSDGTFDIDMLFSQYVRPRDDSHQPITALIAVENTHNNCGGRVLPMDWLVQLRSRCDSLGIPVHLDGARVLNAAVRLGLPLRDVVAPVHSLSMCFSKGIGTPIGSIIAGKKDFIARCLRLRKLVGGGWRQPGPLAAAALHAMEDARARLQADHDNAQTLARAINEHGAGIMDVDMDGLHSNIVMVNLRKPGLTAQMVVDRLNSVSNNEAEPCVIKSFAINDQLIRFVTYCTITAEDIDQAATKITRVAQEWAA